MEIESGAFVHLLDIVKCIACIWVVVMECTPYADDKIALHDLFEIASIEDFPG